MALQGELRTNAGKYGSLSDDHGGVHMIAARGRPMSAWLDRADVRTWKREATRFRQHDNFGRGWASVAARSNLLWRLRVVWRLMLRRARLERRGVSSGNSGVRRQEVPRRRLLFLSCEWALKARHDRRLAHSGDA